MVRLEIFFLLSIIAGGFYLCFSQFFRASSFRYTIKFFQRFFFLQLRLLVLEAADIITLWCLNMFFSQYFMI